jgi:stage II sporulation protein D
LDPANGTHRQALRVLLGSGDAQPIDATSFAYEGRRYRGSFARTADGEIVNTVALEEYLYSVVPREMPPSWAAAALQVQAIVARTFVLERSAPAREYDLVPSEADQVYTGMDSEHPQSTAAVNATAGEALRFQNGFASALYSSCCGGHTESSSAAWGGKPVPYLAGVVCPYCTAAPWYKWTQNLDLDRVHDALSAALSGIGTLQRVRLDSADASGRAHYWFFDGDAGSARVAAPAVRAALGTRVLPSLLVRKVGLATQATPTLVIEGGGLGHGVGLCQWGARGMALQGAGARSILSQYYPGTGIGND